MKTSKLSESEPNDFEAADRHIQQYSERLSTDYVTYDNKEQTGFASNDASYESELSQLMAAAIANANAKASQNNSATGAPYVEQPIKVDGSYKRANNYKADITYSIDQADLNSPLLDIESLHTVAKPSLDASLEPTDDLVSIKKTPKVLERVFMNSLIKHTGIALAIIIPLAAFSAFAGAANVANTSIASNHTATNNTATATIDIKPSLIIYKSASVPTTVDSVDLQQYAGTWYEIARLPMYFQRNCASDVTATYTSKTDGSGIIVTNKCKDNDGADIVAEGLAKPADNTGSKLKVTFLPSWIRWLPVGRADYWVLARDANYQTALVGTPDNKYLWLLARTPNLSQQTYNKYRQIAQQQGYDLKEFTLTTQTKQTVTLSP